MDTLAKIKFKRNLALALIVCSLISLIAYNALKPDPEDAKIAEMKTMILDKNPRKMSGDDRRKIRDMMNKLSPETRQKLVHELMRGRLEQIRKETAGMTYKQKEAEVQKLVVRIRQRFSNMTPEQRAKAEDRMNSPQAKKRMKQALKFFYEEFTPEERKLMDPVVQEISVQMANLENKR